MKQQQALHTRPPELKVDFAGCPVQASMGVLGRKWALLVLRNIGLYRKQRFNEMVRFTNGLTRRVLSMRLAELEREGFIEVVEKGRNYSKWDLTEMGRDVLPVLMSLVRFGSKWYAGEVFSDKTPRPLEDVFDESYIREIMGSLTTDPRLPHSADLMRKAAELPAKNKSSRSSSNSRSIDPILAVPR